MNEIQILEICIEIKFKSHQPTTIFLESRLLSSTQPSPSIFYLLLFFLYDISAMNAKDRHFHLRVSARVHKQTCLRAFVTWDPTLKRLNNPRRDHYWPILCCWCGSCIQHPHIHLNLMDNKKLANCEKPVKYAA